MLTKIILGLLWLGFGLYAFLLAPPDQPDTVNLIIDLSTGKWQDINPLIIALFNLMGVWPIIYTSLLIIDGRDQKIIAWPFAFASFAVGAFAILPYLTLRQPNSNFTGKKNLVIKLLDSPWLGVIALITAAILIAYGLINGNWSDFWHQSFPVAGNFPIASNRSGNLFNYSSSLRGELRVNYLGETRPSYQLFFNHFLTREVHI
jgi:hypothetical protein